MSNRTYSSALNDGKGAPNFPYIWDASLVVTGGGKLLTGNWRQYATTDISTSNVSVSGVTLQVGAVAVTGNPLMTVSNALLATSGDVRITNTAPINVTGYVTTIVTGGTVSFDSTAIVFAQATGNNYLGFISGKVNTILPVSGTVNIGSSFALPVLNSGGYVGITGTVTTNSNITNTAPIAISGVVNTTVSVGNVAVTGGNINVTDNLSWALLSGISGVLGANLSGAAWVTGNVGIGSVDTTKTYLPVSGINFNTSVTVASVGITGGQMNVAVTGGVISSSSNPVGVTGTAIDVNPTYTGAGKPIWSFLPIGGRAVSASGAGSITGYNTGDFVMLSISKDNGAVFVNQGVLDQTQDNVTVWAASTGVVSNSAISGINNAGWGLAIPSNTNRRGWFIQNLSTGTMFVKYGAGVNSGSCNFVLRGGVTQYDGNGASWTDMPSIYNGDVYITGYFGVSPAFTAWQL